MREGWEIKKLGEVCEIQNGFAFKSSLFEDKGKPILRISNIQDNKITLDNTAYFNMDSYSNDLSRYRVMPNDILVALSGATTGKIGINKTNLVFYLNQRVALIREQNVLNHYFLYYYLLRTSDKFLISAAGAAQPNLSSEQIKKFQISFPSISEQTRIVEELDLLNGILDKKRQQLKELDSLSQSIFYDMFGDPLTNEKNWKIEKLKTIAPSEQYKGDITDCEGKFWLLNLDMVESNTGEVINKVFVESKEIGNSTVKFNKRNILYSKLRPYLNKVVIPDEEGYATSELIPLKPNETKLDRLFLTFLLRSSSFVEFISSKVTGAKMPRVSMDIFWNYNIIIPPITLQNEFANKIKSIERQKQLIKASIAETQTLLDSRMDYYFN